MKPKSQHKPRPNIIKYNELLARFNSHLPDDLKHEFHSILAKARYDRAHAIATEQTNKALQRAIKLLIERIDDIENGQQTNPITKTNVIRAEYILKNTTTETIRTRGKPLQHKT